MSEEESRLDGGYDLNRAEDVDLLIFDSASLLLSGGFIEHAYALGRLIKGGYEKAELLIRVADCTTKSDNLAEARSLLQEAAESSLTATERWQRAELLCKIARKTAELGMVPEARSYLERAAEIGRESECDARLQNRLDGSSVLGEIAEAYHAIGDSSKAFGIASSIANDGKRASVLERLTSRS
jgi:tetratricopeptide (TPR) repeat protein